MDSFASAASKNFAILLLSMYTTSARAAGLSFLRRLAASECRLGRLGGGRRDDTAKMPLFLPQGTCNPRFPRHPLLCIVPYRKCPGIHLCPLKTFTTCVSYV